MRSNKIVEYLIMIVMLAFVGLVITGIILDPEGFLRVIDPQQAQAISQRKVAEEMKRTNDLKEAELKLRTSPQR